MSNNIYHENRVVYSKVWKKYDRAHQVTDDNMLRRLHFSCVIRKATNTHSERVTLITFPLQQWLH